MAAAEARGELLRLGREQQGDQVCYSLAPQSGSSSSTTVPWCFGSIPCYIVRISRDPHSGSSSTTGQWCFWFHSVLYCEN